MSSITFYTAAATHGDYGPSLLVTAVGATRELAVRNAIDKMMDRCQDHDKKQLRAETDQIIAHLKTHDQLNDGEELLDGFADDYISVIVEAHTATINTTVAF